MNNIMHELDTLNADVSFYSQVLWVIETIIGET